MKPLKIAIIGECMVELQKKLSGLKQAFGGDTLNTALYLARLTQAQSITTSYVTALGYDSFSEQMLAAWQAEGIDTSLVLQLAHKNPGLYYIETDDTGERSFHYWRNDSAAKYLFDQPESEHLTEQLLSYDYLLITGITLAILTESGRSTLFSLLSEFKRRGGKVIFDNNYRPKLWSNPQQTMDEYAKALALTDIAILTFDDEIQLYGDTEVTQCISRTQTAGVTELIIKRGAEDCIVIENNQTSYVAATPVSNIIDTTAAGDSFNAGFLAKRLSQGSAVQAALAGHIMASTVIQYPGAIIPMVAMPEIQL
ncbi:sugar kinase [Shewanella inventionis]|uniref:2-dehydro-3-deoxygluconokinase n=1 Tax=Shewanella inventionis TaxID=1738770 RepID=A0ABQ1IW54_9GAMM|nr:sugar kinase [Shewanella inventionis]MCL1158333.1 sugar kinase [Shewanella inventionis]UAL41843.1 sugar kinase [Shewanella inventionis]GGB51909.1 2-dehydro-3-deoxygluconokinase [Shewanella inventionis]